MKLDWRMTFNTEYFIVGYHFYVITADRNGKIKHIEPLKSRREAVTACRKLKKLASMMDMSLFIAERES